MPNKLLLLLLTHCSCKAARLCTFSPPPFPSLVFPSSQIIYAGLPLQVVSSTCCKEMFTTQKEANHPSAITITLYYDNKLLWTWTRWHLSHKLHVNMHRPHWPDLKHRVNTSKYCYYKNSSTTIPDFSVIMLPASMLEPILEKSTN